MLCIYAGCIFAEMFGRHPIFAGSKMGQLRRMIEILGTPSGEDIQWITNVNAINQIHRLDSHEKIPFTQLYTNAPAVAMDLLDRMLQFHPEKRISIDDALAHPYFLDIRHKPDEVICSSAFDFQFERQLSPYSLQDKLRAACRKYRDF